MRLARAGLAPLELEAKEGLALLNGTQVSTALALVESVRGGSQSGSGASSRRHVDRCDQGQRHAIRRAHSCGARSARDRTLRRPCCAKMMRGSEIRRSHPPLRSRAGSVFHPLPAAGAWSLPGHAPYAAGVFEREANAVTDNPLMFEDGAILSGGNFHAEPVAIAADGLAVAISEIGALSERRIALLIDGSLSGLPPFLDSGERRQFRFHDRACHRCGARLGKQVAGPSGMRWIRCPPPQIRRISSRWRLSRRGGWRR